MDTDLFYLLDSEQQKKIRQAVFENLFETASQMKPIKLSKAKEKEVANNLIDLITCDDAMDCVFSAINFEEVGKVLKDKLIEQIKIEKT